MFFNSICVVTTKNTFTFAICFGGMHSDIVIFFNAFTVAGPGHGTGAGTLAGGDFDIIVHCISLIKSVGRTLLRLTVKALTVTPVSACLQGTGIEPVSPNYYVGASPNQSFPSTPPLTHLIYNAGLIQ